MGRARDEAATATHRAFASNGFDSTFPHRSRVPWEIRPPAKGSLREVSTIERRPKPPGSAPVLARARMLGLLGLATFAGGCSHTQPYAAPAPEGEAPIPAPGSILQRLIFIGDAGAPAVEGEPVLESLRDTTRNVSDRTVVVFLGDNIYPAGLPPLSSPDRRAAEAALTAQLAARGAARAIFVPGNHDWAKAKAGGLAAVLRQSAWVDTAGGAEFSPRAGCPGPVVHDLQGVRLVTLDTQWWLHQHQRGRGCPSRDTAAVVAGLRNALAPPDGRPVVVAAHHPLRSHGTHAGFYSAGEWIFPSLFADGGWRWLLVPLPGVGPLARRIGRSDQDFWSSGNRAMRAQIATVLRERPPLAFASGHEHNLQVLDGGPLASLLLISGAGSSVKASPVGSGSSTLFAHQSTGYMILDVTVDGALLRVVEPGRPGVVYWRKVPLVRAP